MNREQADGMTGQLVEMRVTNFIAKAKEFPGTLLLAHIYRLTLKAALVGQVIDGETGEILTHPGESAWIPFSQIEIMRLAEEPASQSSFCDDCRTRGCSPLDDGCICWCHAAEDDEFEDPPHNFTELAERARFEVMPLEYDRSPDPERLREMTFGPVEVLPPITLPPPSTPRAGLNGCAGECGRVTMTFYPTAVELSLDGEDGFPVRLSLRDSDVYDLSLASYLTEAMLDSTVEVRPVAITIQQIERVRAVMRRFDEAADEALRDLKDEQRRVGKVNPMTTMVMGSAATAAVRRASMDLTRALADLRRRQ